MNESDVLEVARETFEVFKDYVKINKQLDDLKRRLREYAAGSKKEILLEGVGKINISSPSKGSSKSVFKINEDMLLKSSELKNRLLEKGVISKVEKVVPPSAASVTITPNV